MEWFPPVLSSSEWFRRLKVGVKFAFGGQKGISGLDFLMGTDGSTSYPRTDFNTLSQDGYEKNAIVYACINELGSSASDARLVVEVQNRKGEWEARPDHSLAKLLERPNPEMSGYDFLFSTTMYQSISGNMFWEKERSKAGRVIGLWPMRPDRVGIITVTSVPGQRVKQRILSYTWRAAADVVTLPFNDVMHFKHQHPRDDNFGLPPLAAAAREGDTDNKATDYVRSFFENAAVPRGLMTVKGRIDTAEEKRIKLRLQDMYTGRTGWHDPLILGEGSEWTELAETFRDMDFPNLRKISETRLCMVWQVPPILIGSFAGLEKATYANYAEARTSFWQETLMPLYRSRQDTLNRSLAPEFGTGVRVRFDFSEVQALQVDRLELYKTLTEAFYKSLITRNMAWEELGFDTLPGGDVFLQPVMMLEVSAEGQKRALGLETKAVSKLPESGLEASHKVFDAMARAWETVFRREARKQFGDELEELLKILRREGKQAVKGASFADFLVFATASLVDSEAAWAEGFGPLIGGLMTDQVDNVLGALGVAFDIERPEVQEFLEGYTFKFAQGIAEVSQRDVRELIMEAQSEGWSVRKTREALMDLYSGWDEARAEMIARTETIRSSNAGTQEAWRLAGIERNQWYASIDGRQCVWCESMHKKYGPGTQGISVTTTFAREGDVLQVEVGDTVKTMTIKYGDVPYPPLHPQCRCTILAVVE